MKVETYNPSNMQLISGDVSGVDFGTVVRGNHNGTAVVILPKAEGGETLSALALFLENNGGLNHSQFGKYKSSTATQGITPGSNYLSDYFVEARGVSDLTNLSALSDRGLVLTASSPEYIWMDVEVGNSESSLGEESVNFRFIFEYS
ncbi:MAG: hypothetical protein GF334_06140 [Candidatus Altiarchaeales archaeon]|nr:hypothetical protein [Candidatus Altiarchaeales archaeon]